MTFLSTWCLIFLSSRVTWISYIAAQGSLREKEVTKTLLLYHSVSQSNGKSSTDSQDNGHGLVCNPCSLGLCKQRVRDCWRISLETSYHMSHHLYRVQVCWYYDSFYNNFSPQNILLWDLKAIKSKAVSCQNIPINRSDLGLISRNKQTSEKPRMTSYSRRRQI